MKLSAISRRLAASSFLRRPPTRPSARAAAMPAEVRSRIMGALELRERADHLHHHTAGRGSGVDVLCDRLKAGARLSDSLHDVQHVLQRAGQAVELPDYDRVSLAEVAEHPVQFGPVPTAARRRLLEQAPTAGGSERPGLQHVVLLVALGYAGIAEPHALVGGLAVFHKQAFANGAGGHGGSWKFSFQYPLSEWL